MIRLLMQFSACFALGLVLAGVLLIGLMFFGQFELIHGLNLSGRPLASVALALLPSSARATFECHAIAIAPSPATTMISLMNRRKSATSLNARVASGTSRAYTVSSQLRPKVTPASHT